MVLFSNEKFNLNNLKGYLTTPEYNYLNELLKAADLKKKCLSMKSIQREKLY